MQQRAAAAADATAQAGGADQPSGRARHGAVAVLRRYGRWLLLVAALGFALWLPLGLYPAVAVEILCWSLFAVSIDLLLGYVGLMSFGHAAFWGTSAYATGLAAIHWPPSTGGCPSRWLSCVERWWRPCSLHLSAIWR
jgi:branched-chain amino acid transport system permease protein